MENGLPSPWRDGPLANAGDPTEITAGRRDSVRVMARLGTALCFGACATLVRNASWLMIPRLH